MRDSHSCILVNVLTTSSVRKKKKQFRSLKHLSVSLCKYSNCIEIQAASLVLRMHSWKERPAGSAAPDAVHTCPAFPGAQGTSGSLLTLGSFLPSPTKGTLDSLDNKVHSVLHACPTNIHWPSSMCKTFLKAQNIKKNHVTMLAFRNSGCSDTWHMLTPVVSNMLLLRYSFLSPGCGLPENNEYAFFILVFILPSILKVFKI